LPSRFYSLQHGSIRAITHHQRLQLAQAAKVEELAAEQIELIKHIAEDVNRVTEYVRYLRARAWEDDPRFIEDISEGGSKFAPSWHDLKREYGLWNRDSDEHEGAMRVMRGERTRTEEYLRAQLGDDGYERLRKMQQEESQSDDAGV
jgi:hypothetical protein